MFEFVNGVSLIQGDCLEKMKDIPDGSVDMILADLPYGTTACEWDARIPLEPLWEQYRRVIKENGAIVLTSQMPFGAELIQSNREMFRYEWIWEKTRAVGFLNCKKMPMRVTEHVLIFYKKLPTYNPQMREGEPYMYRVCGGYSNLYACETSNGERQRRNAGTRYPVNIIKFKSEYQNTKLHPTQKPVALLEYLIKTYTNEGETVLDNVMGSGSTGVAAVNTGRKFIGIELDEKFFETARGRIEKAIEENKTPAPEAVF